MELKIKDAIGPTEAGRQMAGPTDARQGSALPTGTPVMEAVLDRAIKVG